MKYKTDLPYTYSTWTEYLNDIFKHRPELLKKDCFIHIVWKDRKIDAEYKHKPIDILLNAYNELKDIKPEQETFVFFHELMSKEITPSNEKYFKQIFNMLQYFLKESRF